MTLKNVPDNKFIRQLVPPADATRTTVEACREYCDSDPESHLGRSWNKCDFFVMLNDKCNIGSLNYEDPNLQGNAVDGRESQVYFKKGIFFFMPIISHTSVAICNFRSGRSVIF